MIRVDYSWDEDVGDVLKVFLRDELVTIYSGYDLNSLHQIGSTVLMMYELGLSSGYIKRILEEETKND